MSIKIRDIQNAQQELLNEREPLIEPFVAVIVEVDGSTTQVTRPNYTYIKQLGDDATILAVYNDSVKPVADLPVIVAPSPIKDFQLRIQGVYGSELLPSNSNAGLFSLPIHGETHEYQAEDNVGLDVVMIYQPSLIPLKTIAENGDLTIDIQPLVYTRDGVRYEYGGDAGLDISTYVATAGNIKHILIYLDIGTNTIAILDSGEVLNNGIFPIPFPIIPGRNISSCYILLNDTQTIVTTVDNVIDARGFLSGSAVSEPYVAERVGDILISIDGVTFERGLPVVDNFGQIVVSNQGVIIVT